MIFSFFTLPKRPQVPARVETARLYLFSQLKKEKRNVSRRYSLALFFERETEFRLRSIARRLKTKELKLKISERGALHSPRGGMFNPQFQLKKLMKTFEERNNEDFNSPIEKVCRRRTVFTVFLLKQED